ncbi:preprotein translocase subunit SecA [Mesomycoplasma hyorhinis]|uniref:preprotein translocase subunit SecA n=1 Tax=Mesomycoplasma hyorhinis TaxID=2100 RepID=UPI00136F0EEE|nr:preprotein translocase subunit SecA [Mesomycoplasma hyorhinis]MXR58279.1 preprotein translocase subunit SecA [Mesomycoplasma hyorhinis]
MKAIQKFFSTSSEMRLAQRLLKKINDLTGKYSNMSDSELTNQTFEFKKRLSAGETLADIRVEAFAVAREATKRILGKKPYDVQILGGLILDFGSVAEMKTGEGKTIASIAPVYLNALAGEGVIVSTVNEYLTERDAQETGQVYNFLGLSVGINKVGLDNDTKRLMYSADITYSVHSELGFDYLRDNMVFSKEEKVQRSLNFCLIDEVDSILIDEAKTPLIISGGQNNNSSTYLAANQFVNTLKDEDFYIDLETKGIKLNDQGIDKANSFFKVRNLYEIDNSELVHRVQNALRACKVMKRDVEYIVRDGKIELVDPFTGRVMQGRSYSEGLQQALQAKENLEIEPETQTLATITYQNFFRLFKKLCGMTGTAKTEEQEFIDVYNMRVNVIPTNKPIHRKDDTDLIFASLRAKNKAIINEIKKIHATGQPILVGTSQVNESETLSELLNRESLFHTVLNAKQNEQEADIISRAGQKGAITIATNMAGRGTDIKLGEGVLELGGLYILGTDKAEARRIDNQLRGRSGRQGDIGYSRFFISIEDPLLQRFSNFQHIQNAYSEQGDEPIKGKTIHSILLRAQKKIEGFNFDTRKSVLSYDDVIRQERDLIYTQRDILLESTNLDHYIQRMISRTVDLILGYDFIIKSNKEVNYTNLVAFLNDNLSRITKYDFSELNLEKYHYEDLKEVLEKALNRIYFETVQFQLKQNLGDNYFASERYIILTSLDAKWKGHIDTIDKLRSSANLVQYSQKNPYQIFTEEVTKKFQILINESAYQAILSLFNNSNARKNETIDYQLSNGQTISFNADTPAEIIQQVIEQNEIQLEQLKIEYEKKQNHLNALYEETQRVLTTAQENVLDTDFEIYTLSDGSTLNINKYLDPEFKKQMILEAVFKLQENEMLEQEQQNILENSNKNEAFSSNSTTLDSKADAQPLEAKQVVSEDDSRQKQENTQEDKTQEKEEDIEL